MTYADFTDTYGIVPPQWPHFRALVGDKSDNLAGVQGIGEQTACELLRKYATLEDVLDALARFETTGLTRVQERNIRRAHALGDLAKWIRIHTLGKTLAPEAAAQCN